MTFLLVDDDPDDSMLFREVVTGLNKEIHLTSATNGKEALDILRHEDIDLPQVIFLDLNMPKMDGKECLKEIKQDSKLQHIPVIMYTTSSQSRDIEETMMLGAVCFITKPSSIKELKNIVDQIAGSLPHNLEKTLRTLSNNVNTFIVC